MIRGKPKSFERLATRFVKRAYYYSKKFPTFKKGKLERGDINFQGRKLLNLEIVNNSIYDREISSIFAKAIRDDLTPLITRKSIVEYVLRRVGVKNKLAAVSYLDSLNKFIKAQIEHAKKTSEEYGKQRNRLSFAEKKIFSGNIRHIVGNQLSSIYFIIQSAKMYIKRDEIKMVTWKDRK